MFDLGWVGQVLPLIAAGFGVGLLVGLIVVGGGALMTPLLISTFGLSPQIAVGTDLLYASITKTAADGGTTWLTMSIGRSCSGWPRKPPRRGAAPAVIAVFHRRGAACSLDQDGSRRGAAS
jgi:hypothetical protein